MVWGREDVNVPCPCAHDRCYASGLGLCGDVNVLPLAHMLDATQLVCRGGCSRSLPLHMLTCWMLPVDGRQLAGTSHCVFRETSISTPADVVFNQVCLRIVLCCTASQTNVASAVLRLRLAPTSRKPASPDPWERHHPSQYQQKQTQGLEDLQH